MNITIVGAGISGLSAAFELQKSGFEVTILEGSERLGGKILTSEIEGFNIDAGPDSFLTRDPEMRDLCFALGVGDELVPPTGKPAKVWVGGEMHSLPKRHFLGVPLDLDELEELSLLTEEGAKRAKLDLTLPDNKPKKGETVGSLIRRRLGDEPTIATSLFGMAEIHLKQGEQSRAEANYREALQVRRQLKDGAGEIAALVGLGSVYQAKAQFKEALQIWNEGISVAHQIGDRPSNADFLSRMAETHLGQNRLDEAALCLGQAAQLVADSGALRVSVDVLRNQAALALARGEFDHAFTFIDQALGIGGVRGAEAAHGIALRVRARILHESVENMPGDNSETLNDALQCYERALKIFEEASEPRELRSTLLAFGDFLDLQGDGARAAAVRGRADTLKRS